MENESLIYRLLELGGTAAVLWFVLLRVERSIKENTEALNELKTTLAVLLDRHVQAQMETRARVQENTKAVVDELRQHRHGARLPVE